MFAHNFYCLWMFPKVIAINSSENWEEKTRNLLIFSPISAFRRLSPHLWAIKNKNYISCVTPLTCIVLKRTDPILLMKSFLGWESSAGGVDLSFRWNLRTIGLKIFLNTLCNLFPMLSDDLTSPGPQFHSYVVASFYNLFDGEPRPSQWIPLKRHSICILIYESLFMTHKINW